MLTSGQFQSIFRESSNFDVGGSESLRFCALNYYFKDCVE